MYFLVKVPQDVLRRVRLKASYKAVELWKQNEWIEKTLACSIIDGLYNFEEYLRDEMYEDGDIIREDFF